MGEVVKNKGAIIGVALFVLQQLSGVNAIVYFSSTVFAQARLDPKSCGNCYGVFLVKGYALGQAILQAPMKP